MGPSPTSPLRARASADRPSLADPQRCTVVLDHRSRREFPPAGSPTSVGLEKFSGHGPWLGLGMWNWMMYETEGS